MAVTVLVGVLALVGICSIISALYVSLYSAKGAAKEYVVLPVKGHMEDIEFHIRGTVARMRKSGSCTSKIYLVDFGTDDETAEIAKKMCSEFEILEWVDSFELAKNIRENLDKH